jgi:hypothetical protein
MDPFLMIAIIALYIELAMLVLAIAEHIHDHRK